MRVKPGDEDAADDVQMAPLIDCVFLLLIFFLAAATLKQAHNEVRSLAAPSVLACLAAVLWPPPSARAGAAEFVPEPHPPDLLRYEPNVNSARKPKAFPALLGTAAFPMPVLRGSIARIVKAGTPLELKSTGITLRARKVYLRGYAGMTDLARPEREGRIEELVRRAGRWAPEAWERSIQYNRQHYPGRVLDDLQGVPLRLLGYAHDMAYPWWTPAEREEARKLVGGMWQWIAPNSSVKHAGAGGEAIVVAPEAEAPSRENVPVNALEPGRMLRQWVVAAGLPAGGDDPLAALGGPAAARPREGSELDYRDLSVVFTALGEDCIRATPALAGKEESILVPGGVPNGRAVLYSLLEVREETRAELDCSHPMGYASSRAWLNGAGIPEGASVILKPGLHRMLIELAGNVVRPAFSVPAAGGGLAQRMRERVETELLGGVPRAPRADGRDGRHPPLRAQAGALPAPPAVVRPGRRLAHRRGPGGRQLRAARDRHGEARRRGQPVACRLQRRGDRGLPRGDDRPGRRRPGPALSGRGCCRARRLLWSFRIGRRPRPVAPG